MAVAMACLAGGRPTLTAPVFTSSSIRVSPDPPLEGDVAVFTVTLRNTGDQPAPFSQLRVGWPLMGFFVDASGLENVRIDHEARTLEAAVDLPPGQAREFAVRVLAPRDSGGDTLTLSLHLAHYGSGAELWDHHSVTIDTRLGEGGVSVGRYRITPAGVVVLGVLGGGLLLWLILKVVGRREAPESGFGSRGPGTLPASFSRRMGAGAAASAIMISAGFWLMSATMAWRDYRVLNGWAETTCEILGGRINAETSLTTGSSRSRASSTNTTYEPLLALRYDVDGREVMSTGYDTGSSLRVGGLGRREEELRQWTIGARVPCWYDPSEPADVVVRRGYGGAYLFALFPVPVFLFGCALAWRLVRPRPSR
jgi:hypothetical protein